MGIARTRVEHAVTASALWTPAYAGRAQPSSPVGAGAGAADRHWSAFGSARGVDHDASRRNSAIPAAQSGRELRSFPDGGIDGRAVHRVDLFAVLRARRIRS